MERRMFFSQGMIGLGLLAMLLLPNLLHSAEAAPGGQRLRELAGRIKIGFAAANNFWQLPDSATYQSVAASEFDLLTPENQLKWDAVHPQQGTYNFAPADQHIQFAQAHGMTVHGHTLVWHNQVPGWITGRSWTASELSAVLNEHIATVVGRYRDQIAIWDVVNEAFNDDGTRRTSIWQTTLGSGYIEQAFRQARQADGDAVLLYNDYNIEPINAKSNALYALAVDFKQRGVPLDGIGFQMHLSTQWGLDYASFAANMQRFADLGLDIYITEMDVRIPTPASSANLTTQATIYRNVLDRCLLQPACKAVQVWGFTDAYSWVPDVFGGEGAALIFDALYAAKPAYYALQERLAAQQPVTPTATPRPSTATPTATPRPITAMPTATPQPTTVPTVTLPPATPTRTATPVTPTPGSGLSCSVAYRVTSQWQDGFIGDITITNTGTTPINGWTLRWTFGGNQRISNLWNGVVSQNGASVAASAAAWNQTIAPGARANLGFQASYSGVNGLPTAFTLNNGACTNQ